MNKGGKLLSESKGRIDLEFGGILFKNTTYTKAGLADIIDFLKELSVRVSNYTNQESKVFHLELSDFLQEFESEEVFKRYKDFYNNEKSKIYPNSQKPFIRGEFFYQGKYYLLLGTKCDFSEKDVTNEKMFQGIIFTRMSSEDFSEVSTSERVDKIIK